MSRASKKDPPRARDTRKGRRASGVREKGRPIGLTRTLISAFARCVKLGLSQAEACGRLNIAGSTFAEWKRRGRVEAQRIEDERRRVALDRSLSILDVPVEPLRSEKIFLDFLEALQKADSDFIEDQLAQIRKAGKRGTWQASAWILERRRPDDFGRRSPQADAPPPPAAGGSKPLGGMGIRTTEIYLNGLPPVPLPTPENITAHHAPQPIAEEDEA